MQLGSGSVCRCFAIEFDGGIRQIGNCAPPLFMRAVIEHICPHCITSKFSARQFVTFDPAPSGFADFPECDLHEALRGGCFACVSGQVNPPAY